MPDIAGYDDIKTMNELDKRSKIGIATGWGEKLKLIEVFNIIKTNRNI
jgi:hypothetical protein